MSRAQRLVAGRCQVVDWQVAQAIRRCKAASDAHLGWQLQRKSRQRLTNMGSSVCRPTGRGAGAHERVSAAAPASGQPAR